MKTPISRGLPVTLQYLPISKDEHYQDINMYMCVLKISALDTTLSVQRILFGKTLLLGQQCKSMGGGGGGVKLMT